MQEKKYRIERERKRELERERESERRSIREARRVCPPPFLCRRKDFSYIKSELSRSYGPLFLYQVKN